MVNRANFSHEVLSREVERILPELMARLWGNGSLRLDTDTLSIADDYHTLEWLSRIVAGFMFDERSRWKPNMDALMKDSAYDKKRMRELDGILKRLTEASAKDEVTVAELQEEITKYRDPLTYYMDSLRQKRNPALDILEEQLRNKSKDQPEQQIISDEDSSEEKK